MQALFLHRDTAALLKRSLLIKTAFLFTLNHNGGTGANPEILPLLWLLTLKTVFEIRQCCIVCTEKEAQD